MPKKIIIQTLMRSLFFSSFSYFLTQSASLQTRSSDFEGMSIPQTLQCLCDGVFTNAFDRFGMFLTFCFTADASTIESLRMNQGSFKRSSLYSIFNSSDVSAVKNTNFQPTFNGQVYCDWINSSTLSRAHRFSACDFLQLA